MNATEAQTAGDAAAIDARLVEQARREPAAFTALYDRYVEPLYRYAYRRAGSHAEAEDVTAQTFRRALEALPAYESRGLPFSAWLFRIAHNALVDGYRAAGRTVSLDGLGEGGWEAADASRRSPLELAVLDDEAGAVWRAVAALPPLQRRAVTLRFGRDLSHAEVGGIIGRSEAATKQLIYRAMLTLRRRLAANEEAER
jgi:RNA polymerase sigma-70 factor (ECF subfamily)